jgi:hypothetical protein
VWHAPHIFRGGAAAAGALWHFPHAFGLFDASLSGWNVPSALFQPMIFLRIRPVIGSTMFSGRPYTRERPEVGRSPAIIAAPYALSGVVAPLSTSDIGIIVFP